MPESYILSREYLLELDAQVIAHRIGLAERLAILKNDLIYARSQLASNMDMLSLYRRKLTGFLQTEDDDAVNSSPDEVKSGTCREASGAAKELVKDTREKTEELSKSRMIVEEINSEIAGVKDKIELLDNIRRTACASLSWAAWRERSEGSAEDSTSLGTGTLDGDAEVGGEVSEPNSETNGGNSTHIPDSLECP